MMSGQLNFSVRISELLTVTTGVNFAAQLSDSNNILINIPGYDGSADGYNGKYKKISQIITAKNIASMFRVDNICWNKDTQLAYAEFMHALLVTSTTHIRKNSLELCQTAEPNLYIAATSAAAPHALLWAHHLNVSKLLILAPVENFISREMIASSLKHYTGELTIAYGDQDSLVDADFVDFILQSAENASSHKVIRLENCDHHFSGSENSRKHRQIYIETFETKFIPKARMRLFFQKFGMMFKGRFSNKKI